MHTPSSRALDRFLIVVAIGALALSAACSDDDDSKPTPCTPGTEGCECAAGDECQATNDDGVALVCTDGFCVQDTATCPAGSEGCACKDDGTCDALDGVPMTCSNNICERTTSNPPGTLGGPCLAGNTCNDDLVCVNNVCEEPGCPSGTIGCPCGPMGACDDPGARCSENVCVMEGCEPGTALCTCDNGSCNDGLSCVDNLCRVPNGVDVAVTGGDSRACDLWVETTGRKVSSVVFPAGVRGKFQKRDAQVAIALIRTADEPLTGSVATLVLEGDDAAEPTQIQTSQISCFNRLGQPETGVEITLR